MLYNKTLMASREGQVEEDFPRFLDLTYQIGFQVEESLTIQKKSFKNQGDNI